MKKLFLSLIMVIIGASSAFAVIDKYSINRKDLPEAARNMLSDYFPKAKVSMIKVDRHLLKKTDYDVRLVNGTRIEFSNSGRWTMVDCGRRALPATLPPAPVRRYVSKNYPRLRMVRIERSASAVDVTLSDGVRLRFGPLGNFREVLGAASPRSADAEVEVEIEDAG